MWGVSAVLSVNRELWESDGREMGRMEGFEITSPALPSQVQHVQCCVHWLKNNYLIAFAKRYMA